MGRQAGRGGLRAGRPPQNGCSAALSHHISTTEASTKLAQSCFPLPQLAQVMFPDLASGIAAAREADVFIGMHGEYNTVAAVVCGVAYGSRGVVQGCG